MQTLWQDLRYGARMLLKQPGFTLIAVLTLALGIGANTAIFSVVNAVLLRPLPFNQPEQLVRLVSVRANNPDGRISVSYADFLDWQKETGVFAHAACYSGDEAVLQGDEPERIRAAVVTEDFFAVLNAPMLLGRAFTADESRTGAPVSVISYGLWQRRFGSDARVIGKKLPLAGQNITIIGVTPPKLHYPENVEAWVPFRLAFSNRNDPDLLRRDNFIFQAIARLQPGVSPAQASARLATIARQINQENPNIRQDFSACAVPLLDYAVPRVMQRGLLILLGAVAFVLLIACVNLANLLLARAAGRERELAIRLALGAGRWRVVRQMLTESLLLGLLGGAGGLLLAVWGAELLVKFAPAEIPRLNEAQADLRVLGFTLLITLGTSLLCGWLPALHASRAELNSALKDGTRAAGSARGQRVRAGLVVAEIALALVLLAGAGLLVKSFLLLQRVEPGFNTSNVLTFEINLNGQRLRTPELRAEATQRLTQSLAAVPGVQTVAATSALPLNGGGNYLGRVFLREGAAEPPAAPDFPGAWNVVTPDYFKALDIRLRKGRLFTERDDAKTTPVIIVSETFARAMFPGEDPLGKRIRSWRDENKLREIVGVVSDVIYQERDAAPEGLIYVPHRQDAGGSLTIVVRTAGEPAAVASAVRQALRAADKETPLANLQTLGKVLDDSTARQRFGAWLLGVFALLALCLAGLGIYGVMSYAVTQRVPEFGIRLALGAQARDVLVLVLRGGLQLALSGMALGLLAALAVTRLLKSLLFNVSTTDPLTFGVVALLLAVVALLACWFPARRATKVDPLIALRCD